MKKLILFILLSALLSNISIANEIKENCEKVIRNYFGSSAVFSFYEYSIDPKVKAEIELTTRQKFFKEKIVVWEVKQDNKLVALGLLDNVYGKSLPITFLTLFDVNGNVIKSDIIKYRESHGGGVTNESWLKQFDGRNNNSSYNAGTDIQVISGATISSHSVSKGINKLALLVRVILEKYGYKTASVK